MNSSENVYNANLSPNSSSSIKRTSATMPMSVSGSAIDPLSNDVDDAASQEDSRIFSMRAPSDRPVFKMSVNLITTYKYINKVYYESMAQKTKDKEKEVVADGVRGGAHNDGFDDINYDYLFKSEEMVNERYILKHRMGKVNPQIFF
jgi:arginine/lysine/ornithine decarboxylase